MFKSQKSVFWQALLITILIFGIGVFTGVILEIWRTNEVVSLYQQSEIDLLDIKILNEIYSGGSFDCEIAVKENLNFAARIYEEAKILDKYEGAAKLTETIRVQHKKYDLLRTMLLLNSIKIKEKCNVAYYDVIYFYDYQDTPFDMRAKQNVLSKLLSELKKKKGNEILLIPIAADIGANSINFILEKYNISKNEIPIIIIDEKIKISELLDINSLETYFK